MKGNNPAKPLVRIRKYRAARNGIPLLCPPKRSRCFALLSPHPNRPPASDATARAFSECCKRFTFIRPFDSAKPPCPLLQSILTVKTLFHRPVCDKKKRFALPAPNSAIKARFHRPDYAKNAPSICRLHLNLSCKAHLAPRTEKKHEKTRPFAPSNRLSLTDTTKEKLVRSPDNKRHTRRAVQARLVSLDNQQPKEKPEVMQPIKLFSRHSATIGKKQKRIPSPPQLKKTRRNRSPRRPTTNRENAATGHTPPNRAFTFQPRLCRPLRFFCAALLQILCTALKPLKCRHTKRVEKTFNKKLIPRRKCRTLLTRNRPQTQTRNKKTRKKTSFTQNT